MKKSVIKLNAILLIIILSLLLLWKFSVEIIVFVIIFSVYLLFGWESGFALGVLRKVKKDILKKRLHAILLIIILILLLIWKFNTMLVILLMVFLAFLFYNWENGYKEKAD